MDEVTVMAGVITPSARRAAPPTIVIRTAQVAFFFISANNARMPPSPLLSTLNVMRMYFVVVCRVRVQNISDKEP